MSEDLFDCEEEAKRPRIFWFLVFGVLWFSWIIPEANAAYEKAAAELQASNAIMRWWNSNEPGKARMWVYFWGFMGLGIAFVLAHFVALLHASVVKSMAEKVQDFKSQRDQKHFEAKMQHLENENQKQTKLSKSAQSKKELVMRLGNIRGLQERNQGWRRQSYGGLLQRLQRRPFCLGQRPGERRNQCSTRHSQEQSEPLSQLAYRG